jgi:hypothetical protein
MENVRIYEQELDRDFEMAMREAAMFFDEKDKVHSTLRQITQKLNESNVPYAVVGGMAMFLHGYRRFTEDVDLLVTADGLEAVHQRLDGLGYLPPFTGSKQLRDTQNGVRIEFLITGGFPGDGKPKPVAFPDPRSVAIDIHGMKCLPIDKLVELKLASGMSSVLRLKDLGDVVELIRTLKLGEDMAPKLNPYVREKYMELWRAVQEDTTREQ